MNSARALTAILILILLVIQNGPNTARDHLKALGHNTIIASHKPLAAAKIREFSPRRLDKQQISKIQPLLNQADDGPFHHFAFHLIKTAYPQPASTISQQRMLANAIDDQGLHVVTLTHQSFAGLTEDNKLFIPNSELVHSRRMQDISKHLKVVDLVSTLDAFAALTSTGDVLTWGNQRQGGQFNLPDIKGQIRTLYSNLGAFGALTDAGEFFTWGDFLGGGDIEPITQVVQVASTHMGFAVLRHSGEIGIIGDQLLKQHFANIPHNAIQRPLFIIGNACCLSIGTESGDIWLISHLGYQHWSLEKPLAANDIKEVVSDKAYFYLNTYQGLSLKWNAQEFFLE